MKNVVQNKHKTAKCASIFLLFFLFVAANAFGQPTLTTTIAIQNYINNANAGDGFIADGVHWKVAETDIRNGKKYALLYCMTNEHYDKFGSDNVYNTSEVRKTFNTDFKNSSKFILLRPIAVKANVNMPVGTGLNSGDKTSLPSNPQLASTLNNPQDILFLPTVADVKLWNKSWKVAGTFPTVSGRLMTRNPISTASPKSHVCVFYSMDGLSLGTPDAGYNATWPYTGTQEYRPCLWVLYAPSSFSISGNVDGLPDNSGVTISYTVDGGNIQTVQTDNNGNYIINDIESGSVVVIIPEAIAGYEPNPQSITTAAITDNLSGQDFFYFQDGISIEQDYAQVLSCIPSTEIDVLGKRTYNECEINNIAIEMILQPQHAEHINSLTDNGTLLYIPAGNFQGDDELIFRLVCTETETVLDTVELIVKLIACPDNMEYTDCYGTPTPGVWSIKEAWDSNEQINPQVCTETPIYVGDLDGDGYSEIVALGSNWAGPSADRAVNPLHIFAHDGTWKRTINFPSNTHGVSIDAAGTIALVKLPEPDGRTLIIVALSSPPPSYGAPYLYAYDANTGLEAWRSSDPYESKSWHVNVGIVDFNHDGWPEIHVGANIFDAQTGVLLAKATQGTSRAIAPLHHRPEISHQMAEDVLGTGFPQLIYGNQIHEVIITNRNGTTGNSINLVKTAPSGAGSPADGHVCVADFDGDGYLDVLISNKVGKYVSMYLWNVKKNKVSQRWTSTYPSSPNQDNNKNIPMIGDIDGCGKPEVVLIEGGVGTGTQNKLSAWKYNESTNAFANFWSLTINDASASTGLTMFDFNQDGIAELVYRDEQNLRIINGSGKSHITGQDTTLMVYNITTIPAKSTTGTEYPVIADVDGDGQAEIIITKSLNSSMPGHIAVYKSAGDAWAPARKVWNQYSYNATNVNDNLTIPAYKTNPATFFPGGCAPDNRSPIQPYNAFLQQQALLNQYGCPAWVLPDAEWDGEPQLLYLGDSITFSGMVYNIGEAGLIAPIYITVYSDEVHEDNVLKFDSIGVNINSGESYHLKFTVNNISSLGDISKIIIGVNDKKGIYPYQKECVVNDRIEMELKRDPCNYSDWERLNEFITDPKYVSVKTLTIYRQDSDIEENLEEGILKLCHELDFIDFEDVIEVGRSVTLQSSHPDSIITFYTSDLENVRHFVINGNNVHFSLNTITLDGSLLGNGSAANDTVPYGGGIEVANDLKAVLTLDTLATIQYCHTNNTVTGGGGIYLGISDTLYMYNGSAIIGNTISSSNGGGVNNRGVFHLLGGEISYNRARNGGGIYSTGTAAVLNMMGGLISENITTQSGGGVFNSSGRFDMTGGEISGNKANVGEYGYSGGGVANQYGIFNLSGTAIISGNEAGSFGGGVYNESNFNTTPTTFNMYGGTISNNNATAMGGGVYCNTYVHFNMTGGVISNNKALNEESLTFGGGIAYDMVNYSSTISGGTISNNTANVGGGIANVKNDGSSATELILSDSVKIIHNNVVAPYGLGGGIANYGILTVTDSVTIAHNTALHGGGIYGAARNLAGNIPSKITITDGKFTQNSATNGGGIYSLSSVQLSGKSKILDNTAANEGGGIFMTNPANLKVAAGSNITFSGNTAGAAYWIQDTDPEYLGMNGADIIAHAEANNLKLPPLLSLSNPPEFNEPFEYAYNNYDVNYKGDLDAMYDLFEIWNWADLAYVGVLAENNKIRSYKKYVLMQDLGTPDGIFGDGEHGGLDRDEPCPYTDDPNRKYGWYGYQNYINTLSYDPEIVLPGSANLLGVGNDGSGNAMTTIDAAWDQEGWIPIGSFKYLNSYPWELYAPFKGFFEGQGFVINGLWINRPYGYYQGLFGFVSEATIQNLGVNINNTIGVSAYGTVGGLTGAADWETTVKNCYTAGLIAGEWAVGGLIGVINPKVHISESFSSCKVNGGSDTGGFIGMTWSEDCGGGSKKSLPFKIMPPEMKSGTRDGEVWNLIENCYAAGNVTGEWSVGGFIGTHNQMTVNNCFSASDSVIGWGNVGGFVGYHLCAGTIQNCYALTNWVEGSERNRFLGQTSGQGDAITLNNNYALECMNLFSMVISDPAGFNAQSIAWEEVINPKQNTYDTDKTSWDFTNVWTFNYDYENQTGWQVAENTNLPVLRAFNTNTFSMAIQQPEVKECEVEENSDWCWESFEESEYAYYEDVVVTSEGDRIVVGYMYADFILNGGHTLTHTSLYDSEGLVVKYSNDGTVDWAINIPQLESGDISYIQFYSVAEVGDSIVAVGAGIAQSPFRYVAVAVKIDKTTGSTGSHISIKPSQQYGMASFRKVAASRDAGGELDGGFIVAGEYSYNTQEWTHCTNSSLPKSVIVKYDEHNNTVWTQYLCDYFSDQTSISDIAVSKTDGRIAASGLEYPFPVSSIFFVCDYNGSNPYIESSNNAEYRSVAILDNGDIAILKMNYNDYSNSIVKYKNDLILNTEIPLSYVERGYFNRIKATSDGGFVVAGADEDMQAGVVLRFDMNDNMKWSKYFYHNTGFSAIDVVDDYRFILTGTHLGEMPFIAELCDDELLGYEFYVSVPGKGNMSGSDWDNAMSNAIFSNRLHLAKPGVTFYVKEGIYTPVIDEYKNPNATQQNKKYMLKSGVTILGSYKPELTGTDNDLVIHRNIATPQGELQPSTVFTGDFDGNALFNDTNDAQVLFDAVTFNAGLPASSDTIRLDGLKITHATVSALSAKNVDLEIEKCVFENNRGTTTLYGTASIGSVFSSNKGNSTIKNSVFTGNEQYNAEGTYGMMSVRHGNLNIYNSTIANNSCNAYHLSIHNIESVILEYLSYQNDTLKIYNSTITHNLLTLNTRGTVYIINPDGVVDINSSTLVSNTSPLDGSEPGAGIVLLYHSNYYPLPSDAGGNEQPGSFDYSPDKFLINNTLLAGNETLDIALMGIEYSQIGNNFYPTVDFHTSKNGEIFKLPEFSGNLPVASIIGNQKYYHQADTAIMVNFSATPRWLAPLAHNGGLTQTRALIGKGNFAKVNGNLAYKASAPHAEGLHHDQRGYPRLEETTSIGAYEINEALAMLRGTVFPFVYYGDNYPELNALFPVTAKLYDAEILPFTPESILSAEPIYTTTAIYYNGTEFIENTPKYPGYLGKTNNPGLPVDWEAMGITQKTVDNTYLSENEIPQTPIGLFKLMHIDTGDYVLVISREGYVPRFAKIKVTNEDMLLGHRELIMGDLNGDLEVTQADVDILSSIFALYGMDNYDPKYDLNGDLKIDAGDRSLIRVYLLFDTYTYEETQECFSND